MTILTDATPEHDMLAAPTSSRSPFPPPAPATHAAVVTGPPAVAPIAFAPPTITPSPATPVFVPTAPTASPTDANPPVALHVAPPAEVPVPAPMPAHVAGPAAVLTADPACAPIQQALPALPTLAAAPKPPNTAAAALGAAGKQPLSLEDLQLGSNSKKRKKKSGGHGFANLVLVVALGAVGYAGYRFGPDLYEDYVADETDLAAGEPDAPLSFPSTRTVAPPMRTAEFILSDLTESPGTEYHVTVDFETNVSRVVVMRADGPDLEVLTFGADAVVHLVGDPAWYRVQRGTFPLDERLERSDWVRTLDELIPPAVRSTVTIERSTESMVDGVETRHLQLTLDPMILSDARLPVSELDPVTGLPVQSAVLDDQLLDGGLMDETLDLGADSVLPATGAPLEQPTAGRAAPADAITVEIWVDSDGLIRRISGAPQLGAQTITVLSTSEQGFVPDFPPDEITLPLTASALVELGM